MVCPPSPGSCLPLSPLVPLLCPFKSMVCPPSPGSCLPLSPAFLPFSVHGVSQTLMETSRELQLPFSFLGQLTTGSQQREHCPSNECPLSPPVSACTPSNGWCVRPFIWWCARLLPGPCTTSYAWCARILPGLVSLCAPSYGWCVRFLEGLVSPCLHLYPFAWIVCLPSPGFCLPLSPLVALCMDCVFAFSRIFSPFVSPCAPSYGWRVRLLQGLVSHCLPLYPFIWVVRTPSQGSCLLLSPLVSLACPPSPASCLPLSPLVPFLWMLCPPSPRSCLPLSRLVPRHMDGVTAFVSHWLHFGQLEWSVLQQEYRIMKYLWATAPNLQNAYQSSKMHIPKCITVCWPIRNAYQGSLLIRLLS